MTELTDEQKAAQIAAKMAAPLTSEQRNVCQLMGLTEEAFLEQRNSELRANLPGWHAGTEYGLSKDEAAVATLLSISLPDYAAQKIAEAEQRQKRTGG